MSSGYDDDEKPRRGVLKGKRLREVHEEALRNYDLIYSALYEERQQCVADRAFYQLAGAMWTGSLGEQFDGKPRLEVNKGKLAVNRVVADMRANEMRVTYRSKDGKAADKTAETLASILRADEQDSNASLVYANAFKEGVGGGFGAFRLRAVDEDEEDDEDERQRIRIEWIPDADTSVWFDLSSREQGKADARHCFVVTSMSRERYEEMYGDSVSSWTKADMLLWGTVEWCTPDLVYVAEYYRVEEVREKVTIYRMLDQTTERYTDKELDDNEGALRDDLKVRGAQAMREKMMMRRKVCKYTLSGVGVLHKCVIAGKHIPVIPFFANFAVINGVERCSGIIRTLVDAQRIYNMQLSKFAELAGVSSQSVPIFTSEQVSGHEAVWRDANLKNYAFMTVNPVVGPDGSLQHMGPVGYTKPPELAPAMAALVQITAADIKELLGNPMGNDTVVSNVSTETALLGQQRTDSSSALYIEDFAVAMKQMGTVYRDMARALYIEDGREMKTVGEDRTTTGSVRLAEQYVTDNGLIADNDLSRANFDVAVEVGPSSSSKRASAVRTLIEAAKVTVDPATQLLLLSKALENVEGEGMSDVNTYFRAKNIRQGMGTPTPDEQAELDAEAQAQKAEDPQQTYLKAEAAKSLALADKAKADMMGTLADVEKTRAEVAGVEANTEKTKAETLDLVGKIGQPPPTRPFPR